MTPTTNNVGPTTSATERLRALLTERGVEWMPSAFDPPHETFYEVNGVGFIVTEFPEIQRMSLACDMRITPEQAVAATLGETPTPHVEDLGRLHDELRDAIVEILGNRCDWDQAGVRHAHEVLERAATLGPGTCHAVFEVDAMSGDERIGEFVCSECGETFNDGHGEFPHYCPGCGKRVVG